VLAVAGRADDLARDGLLARTMLFIGLVLVLHRVGRRHLHAASLLDPKGRGWLLCGPSGSGKTTTTLSLDRAGWTVLADDAAFLIAGGGATDHPALGDDREVSVAPFPKPFHLSDETLGAFPEWRSACTGIRREGKWDVDPRARGKTDLGDRRFRPHGVVFLELCRGPFGVTEATALAPAEALGLLMESSALFLLDRLPDAAEHRQALARLVAGPVTLRALRLAPDVLYHPYRLAHLLCRGK